MSVLLTPFLFSMSVLLTSFLFSATLNSSLKDYPALAPFNNNIKHKSNLKAKIQAKKTFKFKLLVSGYDIYVLETIFGRWIAQFDEIKTSRAI